MSYNIGLRTLKHYGFVMYGSRSKLVCILRYSVSEWQ